MKKFIKKRVYRNEFKYEALPPEPGMIRLLTIMPAKRRSAALDCTLSTATLGNNPTFEALSYVWGDPNDLMLMLVDGKRLAVTYNLLEALEALRLRDSTRTFWTDGVCINQADDHEKSKQVHMMRHIYSKASNVVIWLGKSEKRIPQALAFMKETISSDHGRYAVPDLVEHMGDEAFPYWSVVNSLFDRPWFTRIWVCQEFAFARARHFQCGSIIIPDTLIILYSEKLVENWSSFMSWSAANDTLIIYPSDPHPVRRFQALMHSRAFPVLNMARLRDRTPELLPLLSGLVTGKEATDRRDRIYALLGFLKVDDADPYKELLLPDYTLSVRQVFTRTMAHLLLTHDNLNALNEIRAVNPHMLELPSWVANWESGHASLIFFAENPTQNEAMYDAGGQRHLEPERIDLTAETLSLDGYTMDTVDKVFRFSEVTDEIELVKQWLDALSSKMDQAYPRGGSYREGFWRTVFANRYPQEFDQESEQESGTTKIYDVKIGDTIPGVCAMPPSTEDEVTNLHNSINNGPVRDGFRLFITKGGLLGLVHDEVPDQNVIVVVRGGKTPYILEPRGMRYAFWGECYIHGIMNGEIIREHEQGRRQLEAFVLV